MAQNTNVSLLKEITDTGLSDETIAISKGQKISQGQKVDVKLTPQQKTALESGQKFVFGRGRGRVSPQELQSEESIIRAEQRTKQLRERTQRQREQARKLREPVSSDIFLSGQTRGMGSLATQEELDLITAKSFKARPDSQVRASVTPRNRPRNELDDLGRDIGVPSLKSDSARVMGVRDLTGQQIEMVGQNIGGDFGTALTGVGLFGVGFAKGSAQTISTTISDPFSLVEGTASFIFDPKSNIETIGSRISSGPIGAGSVTGEIVTSSVIGAGVGKATSTGVRAARVARFESKIRLKPEQLAPDFKPLSVVPDDVGQAQLFPSGVDTAKAIGQARSTMLGEAPTPIGVGRTRQTRLREPNIEQVLTESGFELRFVPDEAGLRLNLERGRLFKESQSKLPETQLTLPKGSIGAKDFDITLVIPKDKTFISVGRGGLISGRRGQARSLFDIPDTQFEVRSGSLRTPRRTLVDDFKPLENIGGVGSGSIFGRQINNILTPTISQAQDQQSFIGQRSKGAGKTSGVNRVGQVPKIDTSSLTGVESVVGQDSSVFTSNIQTSLPTIPPTTSSTTFFDIFTPRTPKRGKGLKTGFFGYNFDTSSKGFGLGALSLKGFTPSVTASVFNIKGERSKIGELSGLGLRPLQM